MGRIGCRMINLKGSLWLRIAASFLLFVALLSQVSFARSLDAQENESCTLSLARMKNILSSWLMLIRLFKVATICCGQLLIGNWGKSCAPRMTLPVVGPRSVPSPSNVWNAAMGVWRRLWRKTNSSR